MSSNHAGPKSCERSIVEQEVNQEGKGVEGLEMDGWAETGMVDDFNVEVDAFVNGANLPPRTPTLTADRNFLPRPTPLSLADVMPLFFLAPTDLPFSPPAPESTTDDNEPFLFLPETDSSLRASTMRGSETGEELEGGEGGRGDRRLGSGEGGGDPRREGGGDSCREGGGEP